MLSNSNLEVIMIHFAFSTCVVARNVRGAARPFHSKIVHSVGENSHQNRNLLGTVCYNRRKAINLMV